MTTSTPTAGSRTATRPAQPAPHVVAGPRPVGRAARQPTSRQRPSATGRQGRRPTARVGRSATRERRHRAGPQAARPRRPARPPRRDRRRPPRRRVARAGRAARRSRSRWRGRPRPLVRLGNRWAILPMEGWDGTADGRPTDLVRRRWRRFGESGAKLDLGRRGRRRACPTGGPTRISCASARRRPTTSPSLRDDARRRAPRRPTAPPTTSWSGCSSPTRAGGPGPTASRRPASRTGTRCSTSGSAPPTRTS